MKLVTVVVSVTVAEENAARVESDVAAALDSENPLLLGVTVQRREPTQEERDRAWKHV